MCGATVKTKKERRLETRKNFKVGNQ